MNRLVQLADDQGTDPGIVRLVGTGDDNLIPLFTYLISEDGDEKFFLQISSPNRNLSRFSPRPFDTIALSQMLAIIENRGYEKEALVSQVRFYEAEIHADIDRKGKPQTPFTRPSTGSTSRPATTEEIIRCLRLPKSDSKDSRIGALARSGNADVSIFINEHIFNHHVLVAGATGSGKSHLLANLAHVADAMGRCIILFDHKPDHQNHHEPNPDADIKRVFRLEENKNCTDPEVGGPVHYWTLDKSDPNEKARRLGVPAREFDLELLAGTIFYHAGEEIQAETFAAIAHAYREQKGGDSGDKWTVQDLVKFITSKKLSEINNLFSNTEMPLNRQTLDAIKRKLWYSRSRIPSFIDPQPDPQPPMGPLGHPTGETVRPTGETGSIDDVFQSGLNVIRVSEDDARGYALFLSHLLRRAAEKRAHTIQSSSTTGETGAPEMLMIIDEAADIFKADSRYLRNAATGMLAERIRKGRSLRIGYVIAVQDAGDVPENIRHNLNTTIVGRHRHRRTLQEALPTVREGLLSNADKLAPGEMLVDLFGVPSLLLVKMDRSRSKLTVVS